LQVKKRGYVLEKLSSLAVLEFLEDGGWHDVSGTARELRLNVEKLEALLDLLARYNIVRLSDDGQRVRVDPDFKRLVLA